MSEFQIEDRGVKITVPFDRSVLADERFGAGDVSTDFVGHFMAREIGAAARVRMLGPTADVS